MADSKSEVTKKPDSTNEVKYPLSDFYENPGVLNASQDMIRAAFKFYGVTESVTLREAKKLVTNFKERKVTC